MSEVALTADHVIVIGKGKILADASVKEFTENASRRTVRVRTPGAAALRTAVEAAGGTVVVPDDGVTDQLEVTGLEAPAVGELALTAGVALHELTPVKSTLEQAYMELTADSVEYRTEDPSHAGHKAPATTTTGEQR